MAGRHQRRRRDTPQREARRHREIWVVSVLLVGITLAGVAVMSAQDRATLAASHERWEEHGERPEAPPAASGGTRAFQDNN